jgi:hypothetical protein
MINRPPQVERIRQCRTATTVLMPQLKSKAATFRPDGGKRTYIRNTIGVTSGEELK